MMDTFLRFDWFKNTVFVETHRINFHLKCKCTHWKSDSCFAHTFIIPVKLPTNVFPRIIIIS